jgi:hypothetical protein
MNKISKMINEMNNTQKYFLIVSKVSGLYWFIEGFTIPKWGSFEWHTIILKHFFLHFDFFPLTEDSYWFIGGDQKLAFCIMIGSLLGYFLFKDKKEGIDG